MRTVVAASFVKAIKINARQTSGAVSRTSLFETGARRRLTEAISPYQVHQPLRDKKTDAINAKISKSGNSEFFLPKSDDTFPVRELNTELLNFAKPACANCTRTRVDITRTSLRADYERALTMKSWRTDPEGHQKRLRTERDWPRDLLHQRAERYCWEVDHPNRRVLRRERWDALESGKCLLLARFLIISLMPVV